MTKQTKMIHKSTKDSRSFILCSAIIILLTSPLGQSMEAKPYGSAQAEGPTEEFATAEAMRRMPKNAVIERTTCKTIDVANSFRYRCTVMWNLKNEDQ